MCEEISYHPSKLVELLFKTEAFLVCSEGQPFWYTSGTIGPYFVNTHYLYGSKEKAEELLNYIEEIKLDKENLSELIFQKVLDNYDEDDIFRKVMDTLIHKIREFEDVDSIDFISGGERRDWFFSFMVAYILKKPHISIFKDLDMVVWDSTTRKQFKISDGVYIKDKRILHIADLVTEASSYERAWIPALRNLGAQFVSTFVIIDRMQGGRELLKSHGVELHALVNIEVPLFENALELGLVSEKQVNMLKDYFVNPHEAMKNFIKNNPSFIENALNMGGKIKERAQLCIQSKIYD